MLDELSNIGHFEKTEVVEEYLNADGAAKNFACRTFCTQKHPFNRTKRKNCQSECDKKYPPTEKQTERREDRAERQEERRERREKDAAYDINKRTGKPRKKWFIWGRRILGLDPALLKVANAPIRAGVIAAFRINLFGMAIRLYPAFFTTEELKQKGLDLPNAEKAKKAWKEIAKMWYGFGGSPTKLEEVIKKGSKRKVAKWSDVTKKSSFDGGYSNASDPYTTAAIISAAASVITAIIGMIARSGAKKNPYQPSRTPQGLGLETDYPTGFGGSVPTGEQIQAQRNAIANDPSLTQEQKNRVLNAVDSGLYTSNFNPQDYDKSILGMQPAVFWGVTALSVAAIGTTIYLVARKK